RMAHPWSLLAVDGCVGNHQLRKRGPSCLSHSGLRTYHRTKCHSCFEPERAAAFRKGEYNKSLAGFRLAPRELRHEHEQGNQLCNHIVSGRYPATSSLLPNAPCWDHKSRGNGPDEARFASEAIQSSNL